jgi:hypothetical protein
MCPCRASFSWTESRDARLRGKATSMRRVESASGRIALRKLGQQFGGRQHGDRGAGEALRIAGDDGVEVGEGGARQDQVVLDVVPVRESANSNSRRPTGMTTKV